MTTTKALCGYALISVMLSALAGCGSSSPYLKASGDFAAAMESSIPTLRGMKDLNSQLCRRDAWFDYLSHRLDQIKGTGNEKLPWTEVMNRKLSIPQPDGTSQDQTWEAYCNQLQMAGDIVNKALDGLSAYAGALKTVSTKDFSGSAMKSAVTDANAALGNISVSSKVTNIGKTLPAPLQSLAGTLLKNYAEHQVGQIVTDADPDVTKILDGVARYLDALHDEGTEVMNRLPDVFDSVDNGLSRNRMEILQVFDVAFRWTLDLHAIMDTQETLAGVVKKLQKAEAALAAAGKQEKPDAAPELKTVSENAFAVVSDIQGAR